MTGLGRCLLLGLALGWTGAAWANRVAVAQFEGPRAAAAEQAVIELLQGEGHEIVDFATWKQALDEVGAKGGFEASVAAAAAKVKVSAVVMGDVRPPPRRRHTALLMITVRDGRTGSQLDALEVPLRRGRVDAAARKVLREKLLPVIPLGQEPAASQPVVTPTPDTETPEAIAARRAARQAASAPAPARRVARRRPTAVAGLGLSLWGRRLHAQPSGSADGYKGGPMPPGLHLEVEVYPAARLRDGIVGDFGLGAFYDQVWTSSRYPATTGDVDISTTQTRGGVDVRYRRRLLPHHPYGPTVRGAFTFSYLGFKLAESGRSQVPGLNLSDVAYYGFGPTVAAVVPLGRPWLRAGTSLTYLFVVAPDSNAPAGATYDGSWGIDWALHADYYPRPWLLVRAQLGLTYYGTSLKSSATSAATGLGDLYLAGIFTASYVY